MEASTAEFIAFEGEEKAKIRVALAGNEIVDIGSIVPHPKNSNIGDVKAIAESLDEHGQYVPILISAEGVIIKGNHTWKGAGENGWGKVAVVRSDFDYDKSMQVLEGDNRLSSLGTHDAKQRAENLRYLQESGLLRGTGYTADQIDDEIAAMDQVETAAEEEFAGSFAESPDATAQRYPGGRDGSGNPEVAMREIMLMYPKDEYEGELQPLIRGIQKKWGVEGVRDVFAECVRRIARIEDIRAEDHKAAKDEEA